MSKFLVDFYEDGENEEQDYFYEEPEELDEELKKYLIDEKKKNSNPQYCLSDLTKKKKNVKKKINSTKKIPQKRKNIKYIPKPKSPECLANKECKNSDQRFRGLKRGNRLRKIVKFFEANSSNILPFKQRIFATESNKGIFLKEIDIKNPVRKINVIFEKEHTSESLKRVNFGTVLTQDQKSIIVHGGSTEGNLDGMINYDLYSGNVFDRFKQTIRTIVTQKCVKNVFLNHKLFLIAPNVVCSFNGGESVFLLNYFNHQECKEDKTMDLKWKEYFLDIFSSTDKIIKVKPVDDFTATIINRKIYVFGGKIKSTSNIKVTNQLFGISPSSKPKDSFLMDERVNWNSIKWNENKPIVSFFKHLFFVEELSPHPRSNHAACSIDDYLYIFGGKDKKGNILNDLWRINVNLCGEWTRDGMRWEEIETSSGMNPPPLFDCILIGKKIYDKDFNEKSAKQRLIIHGGFKKKKKTNTVQNVIYVLTLGKDRENGDDNKWLCCIPEREFNNIPLARHQYLSIYPKKTYFIGGITKNNLFNNCIMCVSGIKGKENLKKVELCDFLEDQRKKELYTDFKFTFKNSNESIPVHKCILAARSQFFNELFENDVKKSSMEMGVPFEVVECYIKYLYTGNLRLSVTENLEKLLEMSKKFGHFKEINQLLIGERLNLKLSFRIFSKLRNDLKKLLFNQNSKLTDLRIVCERDNDKVIHAHKVILTRSSFIKMALSSGMIEENESKLVFKNLSFKGLIEVLIYFYTDLIENINHLTAVEVAVFSNIFKIEPLMKFCRYLLRDLISKDNAIELLSLFDYYQDKVIVKLCIDVIMKNSNILEKKKDLLSDELYKKLKNCLVNGNFSFFQTSAYI